ncbi:MAG: adenylosuccinate lyase family protein [Proteobacteria bacterium]|nr:adenylosuccinate lyase family protein [Pseudomonadota bacterium]MBU1738426.1 adenylosuccinate lyase family protein [Pseudomonadota bacterium]
MDSFQTPRSHITDSRFYGNGYTTNEAGMVFCDLRRMQRWLDVESALVQSQAALKIIPDEAARKLVETARLELFDIEEIRKDIIETGHSLIPLLNSWQRAAGPDAARYIHFGATTQDIQDTAQSLELRDIVAIIDADLRDILQELCNLAEKHRDLVTIGRTHCQPALPTTLGLKFAVWLDEMLRNCRRLDECRSRLLVSQLFGGVGTMAAFAGRGQELIEEFSRRLGLDTPLTAWHSARDRIAEFTSCMALLTGTMAKIANEICQLSRNETGELEEPFHMGKIGSTTMPHKRNPELCEQVVVLARLVKSSALLGFEGLINEHERDYRAVRMEWAGLVDACSYTCGSLHLMKTILRGLIIHPERIRQNLDSSACLVSTEALMFLVGNRIGKQAAHQLIYELSMAAHGSGRPLGDLLAEHPMITDNFDPETVRETIDPSRHIGEASFLTDRIVNVAKVFFAQRLQRNKPISCPFSRSGTCCTVQKPKTNL